MFSVGDQVYYDWTGPDDTGRITDVDTVSGSEVKYYVVWDGKPQDEHGWFTEELLRPVVAV